MNLTLMKSKNPKNKPLDYQELRENMVEGQIKPNKVTDEKLIRVLSETAKENFVPAPLKPVCYVDEDLEILEGRYLMEPVVFARLIQEAKVKDTDVVLDIGSLYGYSTAVLSQLADTVIGLEEDSDVVTTANENTSDPLYCNAAIVEGALKEGFAGHAPYSVILINGAVAEVPQALFNQLEEGGRLVTIVRKPKQQGVATLFTKKGNKIVSTPLFDASVPYLKSFEPKEGFTF